MQIKSLMVTDNKCLLDFKIELNIKEGGCSSILIGENGSGKSTFLDTIIEILMSFDSESIEKNIYYQYKLVYIYGDSEITITYDGDSYLIMRDGDKIFEGKMKAFTRKRAEGSIKVFPERVNYIYSGLNCKELDAIRNINNSYRNKVRNEIEKYWRASVWGGLNYTTQLPKKKYNFVNDEDVPVYLTAIICGEDSFEKNYLKNECHISNISDVSVKLSTKQLPSFIQEEILNDELKGLYTILEFIDDDFSYLFEHGFLYQDENDFYFEIKGIDEIKNDSIAIYEFLEKIQTILMAEFDVYLNIENSRVNVKNLSEGQRQLIKLFGMLGIYRTENSLSLLDEPDAFMNPRWKYDIKRIIDCLLEDSINSQALLATHDPLLINGVDREDIRIFKVNEEIYKNHGILCTEVIEPEERTLGMGIDGILRSEYYGLETTLDVTTNQLLEEKRNLMIKQKSGDISFDEMNRLNEIRGILEKMTFATNIPTDSYYNNYVVAMHESFGNRQKKVLSREDILERKRVAKSIVEGLINEIYQS